MQKMPFQSRENLWNNDIMADNVMVILLMGKIKAKVSFKWYDLIGLYLITPKLSWGKWTLLDIFPGVWYADDEVWERMFTLAFYTAR